MKTIRIITIVTFLAFLNSCQKEDLSLTETEENSVTPVTEMESSETIEPELAFPEQQGEVINLTPGAKHPTVVEKIGNIYVLGGDIILSEKQIRSLSKSRNDQNRTGLDHNYNQVWPGGKVYYTIDPTLPDQQRVTDAITSVEYSYPYIEFIPRTNEPNYINFVPGNGCGSYVGMVGGAQPIYLAPGCTTGNTMHEIGHALGLFHEQTRVDRDNYVNIHYDNIIDQYEFQFHTYIQQGRSGFEFGSYDFGSIMAYGSDFFSKNGLPTITKLDGSTFGVQRNNLSLGDIQAIHTLYNGEVGNASALYRLENDVSDFGWNNNHLTNHGVIFEASLSPGIPRNVAYFDGLSYAEGAGFSSLSGNLPRTISVYIKTVASNGTMVSWGNNSNQSKWSFKVQNGKIGVDIGGAYVYGNTLVNDGNWHHVACTFSGSQVSDIKLYVDGGSETMSSIQNAAVTTKWTGSGVRIGRDVEGLTNYFIGDMFDVFVSEAAWSKFFVTSMGLSYDY